MKKLLVLLALTAAFAACKKEETEEVPATTDAVETQEMPVDEMSEEGVPAEGEATPAEENQ